MHRPCLAQDPRRGVVRAQHVDHQRLAGVARGVHVGAKDLLLQWLRPGATVEPALADRGGLARGHDQPRGPVAGQLVGPKLRHDLRMDADRMAHASGGMAADERANPVPRPRPDRRHQHAHHAGRGGPRDHGIAVGIERGDVEVAVAVDHGASVPDPQPAGGDARRPEWRKIAR